MTIEALAFWTKHPKETLRTWVKRGRITPVACDVVSRAHLFNGVEVVGVVGVKADADTPPSVVDFEFE